MEMQKSIGQLLESVNGLRDDSKAQDGRLAKVEKVLYAAWAVGAVLVIVGGFLLNKLWDPLMAALKAYARSIP